MNPASLAQMRLYLVVALAIVAVACGGGGSSEAADGSLRACREVTPLAAVRPAPLLPVSPCELPEFDFARFGDLMAQLEGTPVVVNIWASWCGPCRAEAPHLARMSRILEGKVQFLGVDMRDLRSPALDFIAEFGWGYPQVFDPDAEIRDGLGLLGQPHTVIFDAGGAQRFTWSGPITEELLRSEIQKVLES